MTGHKRVESLQSYISAPSTEQREHMSNILHKYGRTSEEPTNDNEPINEHTEIDMAVQVPTTEPSLPTQTVTLNNALQSLMHGNTFHGTVNIYINNH